MRLSEWSAEAPAPEAVTAKVLRVVETVLATFGCDPDPECWVTWGDDPAARWGLLASSSAGLVTLAVRVNIPQEGPRASGKLIRWSRVQAGDFAAEVQGGHRFVSASIEGLVLRGVDDEAERVGRFLQGIFAAIDGRTDAFAATRAGQGEVAKG